MASDDKLKRTVKIENVDTRQSPPKAIVDCSPLQPAISKNKEGNTISFIYIGKYSILNPIKKSKNNCTIKTCIFLRF